MKQSAESLTLHVIDGMFAYEAIKSNNRQIRPKHIENSFGWAHDWGDKLIARVFSLVKAAQQHKLYGGYRLWPWYLALAYGQNKDLQKIYCATHFGLDTVSPFLPTAVVTKGIREQVEALAAGTPWTTTFSFMGDVDKPWLETSCIPSIEVFTGDFTASPLYQGFEDLLELVDVLDRDINPNGEKFLHYLYKDTPQAIACMYLYRMFPDELRAWAGIKTSAAACRIFMGDLVHDYLYTILQLGFPALHRTFAIDYPTQEVVLND